MREHRLVVISDGTRERLNLYRVSVTFSRAWKEADCVLGKGWRCADVLLGTSHSFTRDVLCYWVDEAGFHLRLRPHAPGVRKCGEADITSHAEGIIATMRAAKARAARLCFTAALRQYPRRNGHGHCLGAGLCGQSARKMDNILIINPAEHFVDGMDGDDLMYMWEQVQRSGFIDVWRFQTVEDIEESFTLLGRKVPPRWSGKDATFSTGCTKEMRIAMEVQARNREMQIIGPAPHPVLPPGRIWGGQIF